VLGTATLALRLEDYASQTYQKAIPLLKSTDAIRLAAQINVVGAQRQAVLRYILGLYPVGSGTAKEARDFAPADPKLTLITG
ncbi:MAG: ferritin-like domain-containing protein, partial [Actinomycetota bacterium]|nr:ferritin-like domain-containing protein [Actinomycetota bacterium]